MKIKLRELYRDSFKPLLLGDFNFHVNTPNEPNAKKFLDTLGSFNLIQHVKFPTHEKGNTLDLVISCDSIGINNLRLDGSVVSDHDAILFSLSSPRPGVPKQTITYRCWKKVDLFQFSASLSAKFQDFTAVHTSVESAAVAYNSDITSLADQFAPAKTRTITLHPESSWFDTEVLGDEKRKRRMLERQARRTGLQVHWDLFREQRDKCNNLGIAAQTNYYRNSISEATNSKDKWKIFNNLLGISSVSPLPAHDSKDTLCNEFNNFFINKIKTLRDGLTSNPVEYPDYLKNARPAFTGTPFSQFQPVSEEEGHSLTFF